MIKKILVTLLLTTYVFGFIPVNATSVSSSTVSVDDYATLRDIDKGTFNEYRYRIVNEYFTFKKLYELKGTIDTTSATNMMNYAKAGYNYLPDTLINKNILNDFVIALQRGVSTPNSEVYYQDIIAKMDKFIKESRTNKITGNISATPSTGNAPLNTTFRGDVTDPTGTVIPTVNYIWWVDVAGVKTVIGKGITLNYTFKEEGNYTVFLDVKSNHKNTSGYTDVLPFSSRYVVQVKSKVASIIIKVNSNYLRNSDELKFTPDESSYGLIFDATSSTPTGGAKFSRTEWDFGNGIVRKYDGEPRIERVVYSKEGNFTAILKLTTNEGKYVERKFIVYIHKPIATISTNADNGYIGDKFTFTAKAGVSEKNLSYTWNIIDLSNDSVLITKDGNVLTYTFSDKGRYTIQLHVKDAAGNDDVDTKTIYINSRAPIANFTSSMPFASKPNKVLLDGTKSYDQDVSDQGKLTYSWTIDGEKVDLDSINSNGAIGYYTFDSIGEHSVSLEVTDTDNMNSIVSAKVKIASNLSVDFYPFPKVVQRGTTVRFVVTSPNAKYYEWTFGDGTKKTTTSPIMQYNYNNSGNYAASLVVKDSDGHSNTMSKTVYVGDSNNPVAVADIIKADGSIPNFDQNLCMNGAYSVDRITALSLKGDASVNTDGKASGLTYSWKIGNNKILSGKSLNYKFDELGCYPIKLTVKSDTKGTSSSDEFWVKVENQKPQLSSLQIQPVNIDADPVIVNLQALGATDPDGVIQSYLWYYYTDTDPEPQDYRITTLPNTSFVLPKITGNYYFVVVMKDNNDERYSSEDGDSAKYSISLTGDNINTPLIDLKVNKNSLNVGEEAIFTATAKNVLGNDISSKVEYTWDFDGDGFYDKETNVGNISYTYKAAGTFYAKVRAKYKGMTNVRTIEMNVANILQPSFDYTSIGNKYLFFNTSKGKSDSVVFDMGDGNKIVDKNYFEYTYEDGQKVHNVTLKISEGTKVKDVSKEVSVDMKSLIASKTNSGVVVYSNPTIAGTTISLPEKQDTVVVYIPLEDASVKNISIDSDIDTDSDLNGTNDDDIDNKNTGTYTQGGFFEIPVNDRKNQIFRVAYYDETAKIVESKDISINKDYVEEKEIDISSIEFKGVSEAEKVKIEKLKSYVQDLPKESRLKGMNYISQLQEEWFYETEKTKVILDFEKYIDSLKLTNGQDIIDLLESLLVQGQEDQSVRNMSYNVVKNLLPKSLVNYNELIKNLDSIKENPSKLEDNKVLGKEILEAIKDTSLISAEDKGTIKTQLQVLIYGSVDKIPQEVKQEVKADSTSGASKVLGLFTIVLKIILYLLLALVCVILGFFIWYKVVNKNENLGFQDFIIEKTSGKGQHIDVLGEVTKASKEVETPKNTIIRKTQETQEVETPKEEISNSNKSEDLVPDWLKKSSSGEDVSVKKEEETPKWLKDDKKSQKEVSETKVGEEVVPDWLKGSMSEVTPESKEEVKTSELTSNLPGEEVVPDWLKGSMPEVAQEPKEEVKTPDWLTSEKSQDLPQENVNDEVLPDWLKTSKEEKTDKKPQNTSNNKKVEVKENSQAKFDKKPQNTSNNNKKEVVLEKLPETKIEEEVVPDWLKGSINETSQETPKPKDKSQDLPDWLKADDKKSKDIQEKPKQKPKVEEVKQQPKVESETKEVEVPDWLKGVTLEKEEIRNPEVKDIEEINSIDLNNQKASKKPVKQKAEDLNSKTDNVSIPKDKISEEKPKQNQPKNEKNNSENKKDELWSDGMDVPDWLKTDDK